MEKKKVDWSATPQSLIRLRNEGLEDLHKILQAPQLKPQVASSSCFRLMVSNGRGIDGGVRCKEGIEPSDWYFDPPLSDVKISEER